MEWEKSQFYVVIEGKPRGPFAFEQMRSLGLKGTDFVKAEGMPEFQELREIAGLSTLLDIQHERTLPQYFSTLDTRLLAWGIDLFLAFFIYAMLAMVYLVGTPTGAERIPALILGLLLVPVFKFMINTWMEGSSRQASPGKILIGIKVSDEGGNPIGRGRAFARNLAKLLGVLTLGFGFFSGFFDKRQQCLHDKVAGTLVIKGRLI